MDKNKQNNNLNKIKLILVICFVLLLLTTFVFSILAFIKSNNIKDSNFIESNKKIELSNKYINSVAEIKCGENIGTAFLIETVNNSNDTNTLYFITNYHIVVMHTVTDTTFTLKFYQDDYVFGSTGKNIVEVVGYDSYHDIAVLKVIDYSLNNRIEFNYNDVNYNKSNYKIGQTLLSFGNSAGQGIGVYDGMLSNTDTILKVEEILKAGESSSDKKYKYVPVYQVSNAINQGCSGGAIIDLNGNLIAVNAYQRGSDNGALVIGVSYGISIDIAYNIYKQARQEENLIKQDKQINKIDVKLSDSNYIYLGDFALGTGQFFTNKIDVKNRQATTSLNTNGQWLLIDKEYYLSKILDCKIENLNKSQVFALFLKYKYSTKTVSSKNILELGFIDIDNKITTIEFTNFILVSAL